jgi:hypothetical protein
MHLKMENFFPNAHLEKLISKAFYRHLPIFLNVLYGIRYAINVHLLILIVTHLVSQNRRYIREIS